ncbi:hypothetical protein AFLA70_75g003241, partial [Aspergillus flavus AF70]
RSFSTINELFDVPAPFLHYGVSPSVNMLTSGNGYLSLTDILGTLVPMLIVGKLT